MEITLNLLVAVTLYLFAALVLVLWRTQPRNVWRCNHQDLQVQYESPGPIQAQASVWTFEAWISKHCRDTITTKAASELFKNIHDQDLRDHKCSVVFTAHNYCQGTLALGRYGNWQFLVNRRINEMALLRRKCIDDTIRDMEEDIAAANACGEEGMVEESDTDGRPYLQSVIKETLWLRAAIPLLLPSHARDQLFGVSHTQREIFVNVPAIGRDPESWEDALTLGIQARKISRLKSSLQGEFWVDEDEFA
ncbi:hypothetical protein DITRI_Ditri12bG0141400 [Diplodiscus trichospermus]